LLIFVLGQCVSFCVTGDLSTITISIKKDVLAAVRQQGKSMEKSVKDMMSKQQKKQEEQLHALHKRLLTDMTASIEQSNCPERNNMVKALTAPVLDEKLEEHQANLCCQLQAMHRNHLEEVRKLQEKFTVHETSATTGNSLTSQVMGSESYLQSGRATSYSKSYAGNKAAAETAPSTRAATSSSRALVPRLPATRWIPKPKDRLRQSTTTVFSPLTAEEKVTLFCKKGQTTTSTSTSQCQRHIPEPRNSNTQSSESDMEVVFDNMQETLWSTTNAGKQSFFTDTKSSQEVSFPSWKKDENHSSTVSKKSAAQYPTRNVGKSSKPNTCKRGKKKKCARKGKLQTAANDQPAASLHKSAQKERPVPKNAKRMAVYDFLEDASPDQRWMQVDR
jgi:hypothetical protein